MAPAGEKHAQKAEWSCPRCGAARKNGDSLIRHAWDKHGAVPLMVAGPSLADALRAVEVLRQNGFDVTFPTAAQIGAALINGVAL